jgi:DHA1 family bicyclomycin/chloramphenicol resistance-like MFS transporter
MNQKYLRKPGLVVLISVLSMIPPLATDMYMPSLPELTEYFDTTSTLTSFSMSIFFIFMAVGMLILGPVSDKYGRKPVLLLSVSTTMVFSALCAWAPTIGWLLTVRAIQALGAGGMVTIATAMIRDSFEGKAMSQVISITQALSLLAPMGAPILGAVIIEYSSWKMTFVAIAVLMALTLAGSLLLQETLPKERRNAENIFHSIMGLARAVRNRQFTALLLAGGLLTSPFMAYLGVASYIYIVQFGMSETSFSLFFAVTSAFFIAGPLLHMRIGLRPVRRVFAAGYAIVLTVALLMLTVGHAGPYAFVLTFIPFVMLSSYFRPFISNRLLAMQKNDIGAAAAAMNFGFTVLGSVGMMTGSLRWGNYIDGLGYTMLIFLAASMLVSLVALRMKFAE